MRVGMEKAFDIGDGYKAKIQSFCEKVQHDCWLLKESYYLLTAHKKKLYAPFQPWIFNASTANGKIIT